MSGFWRECGTITTPALETGANLVLHLVGNGREYGKYQALVEAYGLRDPRGHGGRHARTGPGRAL